MTESAILALKHGSESDFATSFAGVFAWQTPEPRYGTLNRDYEVFGLAGGCVKLLSVATALVAQKMSVVWGSGLRVWHGPF